MRPGMKWPPVDAEEASNSLDDRLGIDRQRRNSVQHKVGGTGSERLLEDARPEVKWCDGHALSIRRCGRIERRK